MKKIAILYCSLVWGSSLVAQDMIEVRPADPDELSKILALDEEVSFEYFKPLFLQYPDRSIGKDPDHILNEELAYDAQTFDEAVKNNDKQYLYVARREQSIVGFSNFHRHGKSLIIDLICIDKNHRRHGIGQHIVNKILQVPDITAYRLAVIEKNEKAIKFWESFGFTLLNEKPNDVGNDFPKDCADIYRYYELKKD